jgi:hypothetical protein
VLDALGLAFDVLVHALALLPEARQALPLPVATPRW